MLGRPTKIHVALVVAIVALLTLPRVIARFSGFEGFRFGAVIAFLLLVAFTVERTCN